MEELQALSAGLGIVRHTWHAIEFVRDATHARSDARLLWEKTNNLYLLIRNIDAVISEHTEPLSTDIILIVKEAIKASNRTLDELARMCANLGDREDITLVSRLTRPIRFTLNTRTIQKFEEQLQTNIISAHFALYLLDRGPNNDQTRRIEALLRTIETAFRDTTRRAPLTRTNDLPISIPRFPSSQRSDTPDNLGMLEVEEQSESSLAALKALEGCIGATRSTITLPSITSSLSSGQQLRKEETDSGSPIINLACEEASAWREQFGQASCRTIEGDIAETGIIEQEEVAKIRKDTDSIELINAIAQHSPEKFQQLLADGANVNDADNQGHTLLIHTIQHGKSCDECLTSMRTLLEYNAYPNALDNNGNTALHMSVRHNHLEAAKVLLEKGANVDASLGDTPLMLAVQGNQVTFVELFLNYEPDVNIVDDHQWSLVHHAVSGSCKQALLALLQSKKSIDLDARCAMNRTPLMHLAENAYRTENVEMARELLARGADVNAIDFRGYSALYYAIATGTPPPREAFVRLLLENRADVESVRMKIPKRFDCFLALRPPRKDSKTKRRDSGVSSLDTRPDSRIVRGSVSSSASSGSIRSRIARCAAY